MCVSVVYPVASRQPSQFFRKPETTVEAAQRRQSSTWTGNCLPDMVEFKGTPNQIDVHMKYAGTP